MTLQQDLKKWNLRLPTLPERPFRHFREDIRRFVMNGRSVGLKVADSGRFRYLLAMAWEAGLRIDPFTSTLEILKPEVETYFSHIFDRMMRRTLTPLGAVVSEAEGPLHGREVFKVQNDTAKNYNLTLVAQPATSAFAEYREGGGISAKPIRFFVSSPAKAFLEVSECGVVYKQEANQVYCPRLLSRGPTTAPPDPIQRFFDRNYQSSWEKDGRVIRRVASFMRRFGDGWRVPSSPSGTHFSLTENRVAALGAAAFRSTWSESHGAIELRGKGERIGPHEFKLTLEIYESDTGTLLETQTSTWMGMGERIMSLSINTDPTHMWGVEHSHSDTPLQVYQVFSEGKISFQRISCDGHVDITRFKAGVVGCDYGPYHETSRAGEYPLFLWDSDTTMERVVENLQSWVRATTEVLMRLDNDQAAAALNDLISLCVDPKRRTERYARLSPEEVWIIKEALGPSLEWKGPEVFTWLGVKFDVKTWKVIEDLVEDEEAVAVVPTPHPQKVVTGWALNTSLEKMLAAVPKPLVPLGQLACLAAIHHLSEDEFWRSAAAGGTEILFQEKLGGLLKGLRGLGEGGVLETFRDEAEPPKELVEPQVDVLGQVLLPGVTCVDARDHS